MKTELQADLQVRQENNKANSQRITQQLVEVRQQIDGVQETLESCFAKFQEEVAMQNQNLTEDLNTRLNNFQEEIDNQLKQTEGILYNFTSEVTATHKTVENRVQTELEQFSRPVDDRVMLSSQVHELQIQCLTSSMERDSAEQNARQNETYSPATMTCNPNQATPEESFLLHFWSVKIQSNIHWQLAYEHWDPKKAKTIKEHFSDVYERTHHLTTAMSDEEFIDIVIFQLPIMYQCQFTGGVYRDLTEFRQHLI
ncbi:hypothetical protein PR048_002359 [Dryococelus australis]|uniref:Uncharacterized protein n=1 Tax=Dryococelus australis TaxID=614101 RepID=A0ABQ9IJZ1_9NEOP|nr:hypothetical protein PR048_002359 [Dryococelus australis]